MESHEIRIAQSCAADARQAAVEFHARVVRPDSELVLFFCSSEYDLEVLGAEMVRLFAGIQVVGCTTAGEIGPDGYRSHSLTGASFPAGSCVAVSGILEELKYFDSVRVHDFAQSLLQRMEGKAAQASPDNCFALMLIDGLSKREEQVAHILQFTLGGIPLFGGSVADDRKFARTLVYRDGRFYPDGAVLVLISTTLPFKVFMTHHFFATHERLVVTQADTATRAVLEINGLPAAEEYARLIGLAPAQLDARAFAASPLVVVIGDTAYVRSIQKVNPDGSLTFFCAIDEGVVLRIAHGMALLDNLKQAFDSIHAAVGRPQLVLGCDCTLREQESSQSGQKSQVEKIFLENNVVGFNSYGEQYRGIHVNQTFTGIAIGATPRLQDGK